MPTISRLPRPSPPRPGTVLATHGVSEDHADVARALAVAAAARRAQGKSGTYTKEEDLLNQPGKEKSIDENIDENGFTTPNTTPERPEMNDGHPVHDVEATEVRSSPRSTPYLLPLPP